MKAKQEVTISIRDLHMRYGNQQVLNGITLDAYRGQIVGYIGPNGAGKSTTIKIMLGLVSGYTGTVEILGENIAQSDITYKSHIGYMPETAEMYDSLTAKEYLTFVGSLYGMTDTQAEQKAGEMIGILGLGDVYHARISSYSKGMRQKVLLISSLLHNPDILFLDEPLSGLDANSVSIIKAILSQLADQGKTIFYSSHIMEVVEKISHRILLLDGGNIVADGTFEELKEKSNEGSLEGIFNQMTGFHEHSEIARQFVASVQGVPS